MVVLVTDGRANVSLACSSREPGQYGPGAVTPPQVCLGQTAPARRGCCCCSQAVLLLLCKARRSASTPRCSPQEELEREVLEAARRLGASGLKLLVIDTGGLTGGMARLGRMHARRSQDALCGAWRSR